MPSEQENSQANKNLKMCIHKKKVRAVRVENLNFLKRMLNHLRLNLKRKRLKTILKALRANLHYRKKLLWVIICNKPVSFSQREKAFARLDLSQMLIYLLRQTSFKIMSPVVQRIRNHKISEPASSKNLISWKMIYSESEIKLSHWLSVLSR